MATRPITGTEASATRNFRHHGRDLLLVPGEPLLAYALKKCPAPYFPGRLRAEGNEQTEMTSEGWGIPAPVHGDDDLRDQEYSGGWGEPISSHGGDESETASEDPSQPFQWGHIDEQGNAHGCIDIVWALDGVPSWDGAKYNTLSEDSKRLMEAVAAVNAGTPPKSFDIVDNTNPASSYHM